MHDSNDTKVLKPKNRKKQNDMVIGGTSEKLLSSITTIIIEMLRN